MIDSPLSTAPAAPAGGIVEVDESPRYDGRLGELFGLVLANTLLTVITLGIYRFWAKTRVRQYFWNRVSIKGEPLEYTGLGSELLLGFLVILVVLIPLTMLISFVQAAFLGDPVATSVTQLFIILLTYYLFFIAVYRAQRYRLSRTVWRGIRGGLGGSAVTFDNKAALYALLTAVTLGILYPKMQVELQRYRTENSWFGTERLRFDGEFMPLMKAWLVTWMFGAVMLATFGALVAGLRGGLIQPGQVTPEQLNKLFTIALISLVSLGLVNLIAMLWYNATKIRYFVDCTRFGDLSANSEMTVAKLLAAYFPAIAAMFLVLVLLLGGFAADWLRITAIVAFALFAIFLPVLIYHRTLAKLCETTTVRGRFDPDALRQSQFEKPARGEGMADALDIDGL